MSIIPNPTLLNNFLRYFKLFKFFFIFWLISKVLVFFGIIFMIIMGIKYAAYIPDNPNYRRNYDDTKVLHRNPFTEAPATMKQSEIDAEKNKH